MAEKGERERCGPTIRGKVRGEHGGYDALWLTLLNRLGKAFAQPYRARNLS